MLIRRRHLTLGTIIVLALVILGSAAATATEKQSLMGVQDEAVVPANVPAAHSETAAAASGVYRRWIAVWNRADEALSDYPLEISSQAGTGFNHAALVAAGKAQADGDDLRVEVDGSEVDRWLAGPNTANTKVWVTTTMQLGHDASLILAYGPGDGITTLTVDDTSGFPSAGVLYNTSSAEAFEYTAKDATHFAGVTRAVRNTAPAAGNGGDTLVRIEHDVHLVYGDPGAGPPSMDDDHKPIFRLDTSTNYVWDYDQFDESGWDLGWYPLSRPGAWIPGGYMSNHGEMPIGWPTPWEEIGVIAGENMWPPPNWGAPFYVINPCGIVGANFQNGEKNYLGCWGVEIQSGDQQWGDPDEYWLMSWTTEYSIPRPAAEEVWESWSRNEALIPGTKHVGLNPVGEEACIPGPPVMELFMAECDDVTLTLNSSNTPGVALSAVESGPSVAVVKIADPTTVQAGSRLTYTIHVTNTGEITLTATVTDLLPAQVTPTGVLTWDAGTLTPGDGWSTQFPVTAALGYNGLLTNVVEVVTDEGATDVYTETSFAGVVPMVTVAKQADPPIVEPGSALTYTIRVTNTGNVTLTATITDILPAQVTPTGLQTWTAEIPVPAGTWTRQVTVTVQPGYVGPLTNQVRVTTVEGAADACTEVSEARERTYGLALSPGVQVVSGYDHPLTLTHTLTNTGNVADTVDVSASGTWLTGYEPLDVTLGVGGTATISLYARVSGQPTSGTVGTVHVVATSQTSATATASATDSILFRLQPTDDTDGDGIPDDREDGDTDGDGTPDYQDDDSDGDGVPDAEECPGGWPCPDSDGDGDPDPFDYHGYTYLPIVMRNYTTFHVLNDAGGDCPGYPVQLSHQYREDFDFSNDHDWYQFEAEAGKTYTLRTFDLESRADTSLTLFGMDCTTQLVSNDDADYPDDISSRIVWTAIAGGTYHVQIRSYDWRIFGNDTEYTFWVREGSFLD